MLLWDKVALGFRSDAGHLRLGDLLAFMGFRVLWDFGG
jgi:hypothetical protein